KRDRSIILGLRRALARAPLPGTSGARWSLFVTFAGGMEELVSTLAARLPAGATVLKQRVSVLERVGEGWRVKTAEGGAFDAGRPRLDPLFPGRDAERGDAERGRRRPRDAGAKRAARGAGDHGGAGAHADEPLARVDAAVPRRPSHASGDDRARRGRAAQPGA